MESLGSRGWVCLALAGATGVGLVGGCTQSPDPALPASTLTAPVTSSSATATSSPTSASSPTSSTSSAPPTAAGCVDRLTLSLSAEQKAGQLIMVGAEGGRPLSALDAVFRDSKVGGVVLLGPWSSAATVSAAGQHWQERGKDASNAVGVLVSADQEGGAVERLTGPGYTSTPSALDQGSSPATVATTSAMVGRELKASGVNVNLAPVSDTVPAGFDQRNAPIGAYKREYGHDPQIVAAAVTAAVGGLQGAGVSATLKHFPGLGRITGNTDLTAAGTTDSMTTAEDAYLESFRAGIKAGADLVMVSSALYPKIDPDHRAVFSREIVTGLLRGKMGFTKVVITDDIGAAKAVAAVPVGDRATEFVAAGGDIVLTAIPSTVPAMAAAIVRRSASDPEFAAQVDAAVTRVLDLKVRRGLAGCG